METFQHLQYWKELSESMCLKDIKDNNISSS